MFPQAHVKKVPFLLMTSHLESTGPQKAERKRQLVAAFKKMGESDPHRTVVFGGDLNMRDKEVNTVVTHSSTRDHWATSSC